MASTIPTLNPGAYVLFGIILLLIIIAILVRRRRKRVLAQKNSIPEEVLNQFNMAEKLIKEQGETKSPYQIMWGINKMMKGGTLINGTTNTEGEQRRTEGNVTARNSRSTIPTEPTVESSKLSGNFKGRQDLQNGGNSSKDIDKRDIDQDTTKFRKTSNSSREAFFSRFRRR